jgi:hypothetical protein
MRSSKGETIKTYGLVTRVGSDCYKAAKEKIAKLWPLEVGKIVQFTATTPHGGYSWIGTYKVTEKKDITVKAGTFPVYVVVYEEKQISGAIPGVGGNLDSVWTFYISEDLGYLVKMDYQQISGGPLPGYSYTPWEAISITHP